MNFSTTINPMLIPRTKAMRCNGEDGAKAVQQGPESSTVIIDESGPFIWYIETDENAQRKILTRYRIKQDDPLPPPDYSEMNSKLNMIVERLGIVDDLSERLSKIEGELK